MDYREMVPENKIQQWIDVLGKAVNDWQRKISRLTRSNSPRPSYQRHGGYCINVKFNGFKILLDALFPRCQ